MCLDRGILILIDKSRALKDKNRIKAKRKHQKRAVKILPHPFELHAYADTFIFPDGKRAFS